MGIFTPLLSTTFFMISFRLPQASPAGTIGHDNNFLQTHLSFTGLDFLSPVNLI
jgi:hypothetical protein